MEIQNNWGIAPWFGIYVYSDRGWHDARDPSKSCETGDHLSWRFTDQTPETYVDPTGGEQDSPDYWLRHTGIAPDYRRFNEDQPKPLAEKFEESPSSRVDTKSSIFRRFLDRITRRQPK